MHEKYFTPDDLPNLIVSGRGIYAIAESQPGNNLRLAGEMADATPVWLQVTSDDLVVSAICLRKNAIVQGIGMLTADKVQEDTLSIAFAGYLTDLRTKNRAMTSACLVSTEKPEAPMDYVRLPHLVAYSADGITVVDKVVWELLHHKEAERWLGAVLPDQKFVEHHLPQLLELRAAHRACHLLHTSRHQELVELLGGERYISILFVYQHLPLFKILLQKY